MTSRFLWSLALRDIQPDASQPQGFGIGRGVRAEASTSSRNPPNIVLFILLLSHRKTHTVCKVHYTPMVPCCPHMNSGNCFQ